MLLMTFIHVQTNGVRGTEFAGETNQSQLSLQMIAD